MISWQPRESREFPRLSPKTKYVDDGTSKVRGDRSVQGARETHMCMLFEISVPRVLFLFVFSDKHLPIRYFYFSWGKPDDSLDFYLTPSVISLYTIISALSKKEKKMGWYPVCDNYFSIRKIWYHRISCDSIGSDRKDSIEDGYYDKNTQNDAKKKAPHGLWVKFRIKMCIFISNPR